MRKYITSLKSVTLKKCVDSLPFYDELVLVVNDGIGFAKAVNQGLSLAKGDFLIVVGNDIEWKRGTLQQLCIENTITSPLVNEWSQPFQGHLFCLPRSIYEKLGGLDEQFSIGFFEDDDYRMRIEKEHIQNIAVPECNIITVGGMTMRQFDTVTLMKENKEKFDKKWLQS